MEETNRFVILAHSGQHYCRGHVATLDNSRSCAVDGRILSNIKTCLLKNVLALDGFVRREIHQDASVAGRVVDDINFGAFGNEISRVAVLAALT